MKKIILVILALIAILFLINSVNALEENISSINTTDDSLYSINDDEKSDPILSYEEHSEKLEGTFTQQSSTIEVSDSYDDDEYWVDDGSPSLKVKIKSGGKYTTDGKLIISCDGKVMEVVRTSQVGYNVNYGHIYGYNVYLNNLINVNSKSVKTININFIGNLYNVTNKNTGEHLQIPKIKDSSISIKVRTGTKTINLDNGNFELTSSDYTSFKQGLATSDYIDIYYLNICTGTVKKLSKTTWKKKSVLVFKVGKTIKIGKKKFKSIKLAKKYAIKTFKMAFKGGKYIKMYKKGKKYYQLWKLPVKHYKKVKVYKEVKGTIRQYSDGPALTYNYVDTKGNKVYDIFSLANI